MARPASAPLLPPPLAQDPRVLADKRTSPKGAPGVAAEDPGGGGQVGEGTCVGVTELPVSGVCEQRLDLPLSPAWGHRPWRTWGEKV